MPKEAGNLQRQRDLTAERVERASARWLIRSAVNSWRWAAVPFAVLYLVLLAVRLPGVVTATNLDADAVSAPVIGQLFSSAPAHASVVLGEFGWYASLLFLLATKWLPSHREVWRSRRTRSRWADSH